MSDGSDDADQEDDVDASDDGHDGGRPGDGPTDDSSNDAVSPVGEEPGDGDRLADDPFSEFDAPDGDLADLFTEVASDDIDAQAVWAELDSSGHLEGVTGPEADDRYEDPVDDAALDEGTGDEAVVSKASYCQRCEYFSSPPDVGCSNPGTEILELVDVRHFRVRNCPVVAQRRGATVSSLDRDDGYGSTDEDDGYGSTDEDDGADGDGAHQSTRDSHEADDLPGGGEQRHSEGTTERPVDRENSEDRAGSAEGDDDSLEDGDRNTAP